MYRKGNGGEHKRGQDKSLSPRTKEDAGTIQ